MESGALRPSVQTGASQWCRSAEQTANRYRLGFKNQGLEQFTQSSLLMPVLTLACHSGYLRHAMVQ